MPTNKDNFIKVRITLFRKGGQKIKSFHPTVADMATAHRTANKLKKEFKAHDYTLLEIT